MKIKNKKPRIFSVTLILSLKAIGLFLKRANPGLFLFIFILFSLQFQYKLKKAQMVCLGFEPRVSGWQTQTKPRSYGGHPIGLCSENSPTFYLQMTIGFLPCYVVFERLSWLKMKNRHLANCLIFISQKQLQLQFFKGRGSRKNFQFQLESIFQSNILEIFNMSQVEM